MGIVGQVAGIDAEAQRPVAVGGRHAPERGRKIPRPFSLLRRTGVAARLHGMGIAPRHGRDAQTEFRALGSFLRVPEQD